MRALPLTLLLSAALSLACVGFKGDVDAVIDTNDTSLVEGDADADSDADSDSDSDADADSDADSDALTLADLGEGDLFITEMMINTAASDDNYGEWIEVYNNSGAAVNLTGLGVEDRNGTVGVIDAGFMLPPRGYGVLGKSNSESWDNPTVTPDAWYGGSVSMANSGEGTMSLLDPDRGVVFGTSATYGGEWGGGESGYAWQLTGDNLAAPASGNARFWCDATTDLGSGDYGTPGAVNTVCP